MLETSRWNLGRSGAPLAFLIGGCGPIVITGGADTDATTEANETDPTGETDTTPNTTVGCGECPSGYYCDGTICLPYGCEDGPCCGTGGCCEYYGDCYDTDCSAVNDCLDGMFCRRDFDDRGFCDDVPLLPGCPVGTPTEIHFLVDEEIVALSFYERDDERPRALAVATSTNVWLFDSATTTPGPKLLPEGEYAVADLAVGDLDGDGRSRDLVVALGGGGISVLIGGDAGSFTAAPPLQQVADQVELADVNGDGRADIVARLQLGGPVDELAVMIGDGVGGFSAPYVLDSGGTTYDFAVGLARDAEAYEIAAHQELGTRLWSNGVGFDGVVDRYYESDTLDERVPGQLTFVDDFPNGSPLARALAWPSTTLVEVWHDVDDASKLETFGFLGEYPHLVAADLDGNGLESLVLARAGELALVSEDYSCVGGVAFSPNEITAVAAGDFTGDAAEEIALASGLRIILFTGF